MNALSETEYQALKAFFSFYSEKYLPISNLPEHLRPIACLEALEQRGRGVASDGLRQAINDIIEMTAHRSQTEIGQIDEELRARGLMTLSALRKRFSREYRQILKAKKISTESEYYLARSIIDESALPMDAAERHVLLEMMAAFESTYPRSE